MPAFLAFLFGLGFLMGGWFQLMWGDVLFRDAETQRKRIPPFIRWFAGPIRLWPRRFDRAYAVVTGSAIMVFGAALLVAGFVEVFD